MSFDFDAVQDILDSDVPIHVSLSAGSASLALIAIYVMHARWRWPKVSDEQWDTIQEYYAQLEGELMVNVAIGHVVPTITDVKDNELLCDGSVYDRVDYPQLYAVLDSEWIDDDDSFHVPQLVDKFISGAGNNYSAGATGGEDSHTLSTSEMPQHNHSDNEYSTNIDVEGPGVPDPLAIGLPKIPFARTGNTGGGNSHENRPPYQALVFVIIAS